MNLNRRVFLECAGAVAIVWLAALAPASAEQLPPLPEGAFTYVVIPDTQRYSGEGALVKKGKKPQSGPTDNKAFRSRVEWIAANAAKERIVFVSHVGDIVDYRNVQQWDFASNMMARLDGKVPYGISPGNHDIAGSSTTEFNRWFPRRRYEKAAWYAGGFDGYVNAKGKTVCAGNSDSCQLFEAGGMKFVVLHLECNAPAPVLAWADRMLARYADRTAIVCTHMYLGYKTRKIDELRRAVDVAALLVVARAVADADQHRGVADDGLEEAREDPHQHPGRQHRLERSERTVREIGAVDELHDRVVHHPERQRPHETDYLRIRLGAAPGTVRFHVEMRIIPNSAARESKFVFRFA